MGISKFVRRSSVAPLVRYCTNTFFIRFLFILTGVKLRDDATVEEIRGCLEVSCWIWFDLVFEIRKDLVFISQRSAVHSDWLWLRTLCVLRLVPVPGSRRVLLPQGIPLPCALDFSLRLTWSGFRWKKELVQEWSLLLVRCGTPRNKKGKTSHLDPWLMIPLPLATSVPFLVLHVDGTIAGKHYRSFPVPPISSLLLCA